MTMNFDNGSNKKDANRASILKIAQEIFSKYGYKKTTLDDIANAVRKGKSSLYYYFPSKEDLFQAVIQKEVDSLLAGHEKGRNNGGRLFALMMLAHSARNLG